MLVVWLCNIDNLNFSGINNKIDDNPFLFQLTKNNIKSMSMSYNKFGDLYIYNNSFSSQIIINKGTCENFFITENQFLIDSTFNLTYGVLGLNSEGISVFKKRDSIFDINKTPPY
ncbi:MAG: hypothetical protein COA97_12230 [Flavobacteriales bacterium]|nr:MAG: hypothetical protein COA97_12230 [Flavobacteriales bacterium]